MVIKKISFSLLIAFVCIGLYAQFSGFSPEEWTQIENRWMESQPVIKAYTRSEGGISGQLIHVSSDTLYICQDPGLPVGSDWQKDLVLVSVNEINHVLFQAGGNKLGRKKKADLVEFPSSNAQYSEPHLALRNASVYVDSLYSPLTLEEAFAYSEIFNQAYRKKVIRVSFGLNMGGDVLTKDIQEAIDNSNLPSSTDGWQNNLNAELLDISFRFFNRLIIGGSYSSRVYAAGIYGDSYTEIKQVNYNYNVEYREDRLYAEYALLNTNRYFLRKYEVIAGAGLLFGHPEWWFGFNYYDNQNPDYNYVPYQDYSFNERLFGLQLKAAFHYYFFPGLSIWTAFDVNLNQPLVVPVLELSTPGNGNPFVLPEHELGFSGVRFKLGLSLYL